MSVTILMPVLNEAVGMKTVIPLIPRDMDTQLLVVDGGSTDGSVDCARSLGCDVYIQKKAGIRNAYREAWPLIRGEIVVTFSPDGNCLPEVIPEVLKKMRLGCDMVIASRYFDGAKSEDDDWLTAFGNKLFTTIINALYGAQYTDAMGIFRAYRRELFYELGLDKDSPYHYENWVKTVVGVEPLLSIRSAKRKLRIGEVLGLEPKRLGGIRKLQPFKWGFVYLMQTIFERFTL